MKDLLLIICYSIIVFIIGFFIRFKNRNNPIYKLFLVGLAFKVFGAITFCLVYIYYYGYGDSLVYFKDSLVLTNALQSDTLSAIKVLFQSSNTFDSETNFITSKMTLFDRQNDTFLVVKFASLINLISFSNFYASTIIFSFLSYFGIWKFYETICKKYPQIKIQISFAILFFPSLFFWGSGLMKDTLVVGFLGYLIYGFMNIIELKKINLINLVIILISSSVIFTLKAYVIISLLPTVILWFFLTKQNQIKNIVIKVIVAPFIILLGGISIVYSLQFLSGFTESYSLENIYITAESYQRNHYGDGTFIKQGQGSSYTLGDFDPTILGILSKFPAAVNVTLFRPYLWEIRNPVMAISALESAFVFGITIFILFGLGFKNLYLVLKNDPFLTMSLIFSIFFAFSVGFTSYNFGALVRYKIPCIPFYLITLFVLSHEIKKLKYYKWRLNRSARLKELKFD